MVEPSQRPNRVIMPRRGRLISSYGIKAPELLKTMIVHDPQPIYFSCKYKEEWYMNYAWSTAQKSYSYLPQFASQKCCDAWFEIIQDMCRKRFGSGYANYTGENIFSGYIFEWIKDNEDRVHLERRPRQPNRRRIKHDRVRRKIRWAYR